MKSEVEKFIDCVNWRFAKTMPEIPHEFIVVDDYPEKSAEIKSFIDTINQVGYKQSFFEKEYKYLEIDGYKYWAIGNIINRAKIK